MIMPNHIHILLRFHIPEGAALRDGEPVPYEKEKPLPTLGNVVGWFKYQVTKQIGLETQRSGTQVFQRSYYDHVIRNQQDYNEVWEYITYNPQKWLETKQGRA